MFVEQILATKNTLLIGSVFALLTATDNEYHTVLVAEYEKVPELQEVLDARCEQLETPDSNRLQIKAAHLDQQIQAAKRRIEEITRIRKAIWAAKQLLGHALSSASS